MSDVGPSHVLEGYLTRKECAAELGVAEATLARWHTEGAAPPFVKIGKRILYRRTTVQAWLESRETGKAVRS